MWEFDRKSKFKKQFKLLGSVRQDRVKEALMHLGDSEKPESLGVYKQSMKIYAYELGMVDKLKELSEKIKGQSDDDFKDE